MSDVERVDMGSQAEASSSSKRDMGSYISTMKPSDVKALTRKYKIPRDLHPVAVSSEWTMDRLTDEYIGLYEQYFEFEGKQGDWFSFEKRADKDFRGKILNETFSCMKKWKGRFFFIDRRAIPDAMCWRHHDSDISDPVPKDGFDEADVIALTHQSIDIRGIPSGLLFSAGLAITWEFPKFRPLFKDPEGHDVIPQHTTTPLSADEQVPEKTDSQQRVEAKEEQGVDKYGGMEGSSKKRKPSSGPGEGDKEKSSDHIPCPTPLRTIVAVPSDVPRGDNAISPTQTQGDNLVEIPAHDSANTITRPYEEHHDEHSGVLGNRDDNFDDDVDEEIDIGGPGGHVSDTSERVVIETESVPTAATRPDDGKSTAQEETPMPDPPSKGVGADGAGSSLPPSLFVPTWGIHQRSRVTTPEECRDLMVNLIPPGVREEMNLLDNNVVLDRAWKLCEEHAQCSEGLASVQAERNSLMATNAEQTLRIKELEQQLKSVDEVHSSAVKDLESQLAQKDYALVYAERISGERLLENEGLRAQLVFAQKEKTDAIRKLLPTVVGRLLQSHEYKQSLSVPFNYALQTGWGQGLAEERSEKELRKIMMKMNGFDPYSDKKMSAEYERLFSKTYSYVDRISHLSEKSVQDLLKLHPAPPPRDAPKAGSGGIVFAPKLVKAAEVARSKDTTSLPDPASKHASEGSKAPPSKKT
ncbi:hypothetical protein Tco_1403865 [Tanacetum coccineum]